MFSGGNILWLSFLKSCRLHCGQGYYAPPFTAGAWQCCSVSCYACSPFTAQTEAGPQQDLDAQQACPGSAEAMVCVQREPKVAPTRCRCVEVLGSHQFWSGEWDGLGVKCFLSFACMEVAEDPNVLLVRMLWNPSVLSALQELLSSCWSFHAVAQGCNKRLLLFILLCSGNAAVKQLLSLPRQRGSVKKIIVSSICVRTGKTKIKLKIFEILLSAKTGKLKHCHHQVFVLQCTLSCQPHCGFLYLFFGSGVDIIAMLLWRGKNSWILYGILLGICSFSQAWL